MIYAFLKALKKRDSYSKAINSLKSQVDYVYCAVDEEVDYSDPKVTFFVTGNENADLDKILILSKVKIKNNDHIFICDDDLIYPEDYVKHTLKLSKKHSILTYGGSQFNGLPIASYYSEKETFDIWNKRDFESFVQIPYSGVFYFRAKKSLVEALSTKGDSHLPFACDLSIASLLGGLNEQVLMVSPKEKDWFKHIEIDMSCTIYESFKNKDFEQTMFVNKHGYKFVDEGEKNLPFISVVFVVTRIESQRDVVVDALKSLKTQIYPNYEIVMIENFKKIKTIGKCFNEGVQQSNGEWVLFFADDDVIAPEYLASIGGAIRQRDSEDIICISTNITMFNETEQTKMNKIPTGAWKRDFLLENPFIEWANKYVDSEMFQRVSKLNKSVMILKHNHGYFYRSHSGQASGMKLVDESATDLEHSNNMTRILNEAFGE